MLQGITKLPHITVMQVSIKQTSFVSMASVQHLSPYVQSYCIG